MENEKELRRPLGDSEILEGVAVTAAQAAYDAVYEAVYAAMTKSAGRRFGTAYPSIKGAGTLKLVYFQDWRGEQVPPDEHRQKVLDNHEFSVSSGAVPEGVEGVELEVAVTLPEEPPNAFRKRTGQAVPVASTVAGVTTEKRAKYQPRRTK